MSATNSIEQHRHYPQFFFLRRHSMQNVPNVRRWEFSLSNLFPFSILIKFRETGPSLVRVKFRIFRIFWHEISQWSRRKFAETLNNICRSSENVTRSHSAYSKFVLYTFFPFGVFSYENGNRITRVYLCNIVEIASEWIFELFASYLYERGRLHILLFCAYTFRVNSYKVSIKLIKFYIFWFL